MGVWSASLQAAMLSALSNALAQCLDAHLKGVVLNLDLVPIFQFALYNFLVTPPNFRWQQFLEKRFPGFVPVRREKGAPLKLSVKNTLIKFTLDQTIASAINTTLFCYGMGIIKGQERSRVHAGFRRDFWPILIGGLQLWPLVSIMNFTVVPVDHRVLVGAIAGLVWGIHLSIVSSA